MIKKSKFAAIALSVVMAVSVMPSAVLAADSEAYRVQENSVKFYYGDSEKADFTVEYIEEQIEDGNVTYVPKTTTATVKETTEATCEEPATLVMTVTIDNETFVSKQFTTAAALGHDWEETDRYVDVPAECEEPGEYHAHFVCSRCGEEKTEDKLELNPTGHDWGETVIECSEDTNTELVNGEPTLVDPGKDGTYETVQYCKACGEERNRETHELLATEISYGEVVKTNGIASGVEVGDDFVGPIDEEDIELTNCKKAGSYTVQFFTKEGKPVNEKTYTVAPHHYHIVTGIEFGSEDDKNQCTVSENADGSFKVINHSCYLPITYYIVEHCSAEGCPNAHCDTKKYTCDLTDLTEVSRTSAVAEPTGHHNIDTDTRKTIAKMAEEGCTFEELKDLVDAIVKGKDVNAFVNVKNDTSTCTEDGTADVEYICKICKKVVETDTVKVIAKGHDPLPPKAENTVPPTCTADGSYDANIYCNRCGELLVTRPMTIPMGKHTNEIEKGVDDTETDEKAQVEFVGEIVVDDNSTLYDIFAEDGKVENGDYFQVYSTIRNLYGVEYTVYPQAFTLCDTCGGHKVLLDKEPEIEVTNIVRPSKNDPTCVPGSITLKATYTKDWDGEKIVVTKTFKYYSTINEYRGRTAHTPGTPVEKDGYKVTYCTVCGAEISREEIAVVEPEKLAAVTGLKAETIGMNRVKLTWDAVEGANSYLIIGLNSERTGSQIGWTTATSWTDANADADAFNYYWVVAYDSAKKIKGELGDYVWALGRVVGKVTKVAAVAGKDGIELDWADVTGANSYVILSKTGSNKADFNAPVAVTESEYKDASVAAGTVKFYWVYGTYTNADGKTLAAGKTSPFAWAQAE